MGFVRVGAVSAVAKQRGKGGAEDDGELTPGGGKKRKAAEPVVSSEASSPVITHVTVEATECCASVAAAYNVDVFDVVFLNRTRRRRFRTPQTLAIRLLGLRLTRARRRADCVWGRAQVPQHHSAGAAAQGDQSACAAVHGGGRG